MLTRRVSWTKHRNGPSAHVVASLPEFKAEAVRLCQIGDRTISRIASDLNIGENALREWVRLAKIDAGDGPAGALTTEEREELTRLRREYKRVLMDLEIPKKSDGILCEKKPVRFVFIHRERECFPITVLCRALRVSCSGYHAWLGRAPCARKVRDQRLAVEITAVFMRSRETYGSPRMYVDLASGGICVGRNRIARIMDDSSLFARKKRSFTAAAPNRKWVTDVKAIRTGEGWLYLAAVIDLFSRRVVGHAMSESNDTRLALEALNNAKAARGRIDGLLNHSDRGSPDGSDLYTDRLCALHVQPSMSERGDCWDNAVAESFFSTLEWERLRKRSFATHSQARRIVSEYIDQFFNPIRRHSTNGYFSPIEFELRWQSCQFTIESMCPQNSGKLKSETVARP